MTLLEYLYIVDQMYISSRKKSQDVDRHLTHLETLNTSSVGMMNEGSKRQNEDQLEQVRETK